MALIWTALLASAGIWSGVGETAGAAQPGAAHEVSGPPLDSGPFTPLEKAPWVPAAEFSQLGEVPGDFTPILPPVPAGTAPNCDLTPDRDAVLKKHLAQTRPASLLVTVSHENVEFSAQKIVDHVDPPRFFPLVGPAQLHHLSYRCTIRYTERTESTFPFPYFCSRPKSVTVLVDRDHLHLVRSQAEAAQKILRDLIGEPRTIDTEKDRDAPAPSKDLELIRRELRRLW